MNIRGRFGTLRPGARRRRDAERRFRELVERFQAAPFPVYGLPAALPGPRHLEVTGMAWADKITALRLGHGDPSAAEGPDLAVTTGLEPDRFDRDQRRRVLAADLAVLHRLDVFKGKKIMIWQAGALLRTTRDAFVTALAQDRAADWTRVALPVDGEPVVFDRLAAGRHWVAEARHEGLYLSLKARDVPIETLDLVTIADLDPYIVGTLLLDLMYPDPPSPDPPSPDSPRM